MYRANYSLAHHFVISFYITQYLYVPFESENVIVGFFSLLQLLIGYENGTIVFWDLRSKRADLRAYYDEVSSSCYFSKAIVQQFAICLTKQMDGYLKALLVLEILFVLCFWANY